VPRARGRSWSGSRSGSGRVASRGPPFRALGVLCTPFAAGALLLRFGGGFAVVVATTAGAPGGGALFRGGGRVVALFDGLAGLGINPRQSLGQAQSLAHIAVELPCIALRFIMGLGDDGQLLPEFAQLAVELFQLVRTATAGPGLGQSGLGLGGFLIETGTLLRQLVQHLLRILLGPLTG